MAKLKESTFISVYFYVSDIIMTLGVVYFPIAAWRNTLCVLETCVYYWFVCLFDTWNLLRVKIKINYETTQNCTALQWLSPSQTAEKTHPYMFSQCQAIHCRSMLPCQDTPSVKMPYSAEVIHIKIYTYEK